MTEAQHRKWDILFKCLGVLGAVVVFFYGLWSYRQASKDDSAKEFWKQQFPIYVSLCKTAATIPTAQTQEQALAAKIEFWRLYYGEARLVVDAPVHKKLSAFAYQLKMQEKGLSDTEALTFAAYELSTECRMSMARSWNIPLSTLQTESVTGK